MLACADQGKTGRVSRNLEDRQGSDIADDTRDLEEEYVALSMDSRETNLCHDYCGINRPVVERSGGACL